MHKIIFLSLWCFVTATTGYGQQVIRNLDFEQFDAKGNIIGWYMENSGQYEIKLDTAIFYQGKCSISIEYISDTDTVSDARFASGGSFLISPTIKLKRLISISAYVKSENLVDGHAGIGMRLEGSQGSIYQTNSYALSPIGTSEWKKITIELPLTPNVESIMYGFTTLGTGKVWFDNFEILLDGKSINETLN